MHGLKNLKMNSLGNLYPFAGFPFVEYRLAVNLGRKGQTECYCHEQQ